MKLSCFLLFLAQTPASIVSIDVVWADLPNRALKGENHKQIFGLTGGIDECKVLCLAESDFKCLSIEFSQNNCVLSKNSRETLPNGMVSWNGCHYADFQVPVKPSAELYAGVGVGVYIRTLPETYKTGSPLQCAIKCHRNSFCVAFSHNSEDGECYLSHITPSHPVYTQFSTTHPSFRSWALQSDLLEE